MANRGIKNKAALVMASAFCHGHRGHRPFIRPPRSEDWWMPGQTDGGYTTK